MKITIKYCIYSFPWILFKFLNIIIKMELIWIKRFRLSKTTTTIIVGGDDIYNLLGKFGKPVIFPPLNSSLDSSSLLSYSVYFDHTVLVTRGGSLLGIGHNNDGQISSSLMKTKISQFTEFSIKDSSLRYQLSAVLIALFTCFQKSVAMESSLSTAIKGGDRVFLDIGDVEPISLFGGCFHAAAISDKDEIIFINL